MKVEVTQENLAKAVGMVTRIVGIKSTLPILNNVLLKTDKGRLQLSATDLEIGVVTSIGAKVEKEGSFTIPAKLFSDLVSTSSGKTVQLTQKEGSLEVQTGENKAAVKGLSADEFPAIPEVKEEPLFSLSPLLLKEALKKVVVAAAIDETRPALSGVLFWLEGGTLRLTATDSYRLAEAKLSLERAAKSGSDKKQSTTKLILPQRAAQELIRLMEGADEEVQAAVNNNQVLFRTPSFTLVSRLIEGEFPNYIDIIPKSGATNASLATDEFLRAVKVASLFAREVGNHITLSAGPKEGIIVKAASPQVGENEATLAATVSGDSVSVSFNARFLADAIGSLGSKMTEVAFTGKTSPAVFREEGNQEFLHLIMPLRVES